MFDPVRPTHLLNPNVIYFDFEHIHVQETCTTMLFGFIKTSVSVR